MSIRVFHTELMIGEGNDIEVAAERDNPVLHVGSRDGKLTVWYECDQTGKTNKHVELVVVPTGYADIKPEYDAFIGTAQMEDGLVWHVYINNK